MSISAANVAIEQMISGCEISVTADWDWVNHLAWVDIHVWLTPGANEVTVTLAREQVPALIDALQNALRRLDDEEREENESA